MSQVVTPVQPFPLVYSEVAQFKLGPELSGAAGARARVNFRLANDPHMLFRVSVVNEYELDPAAEPLDRMALRYAVDDSQTVEIKLTSQKITVDPVHQAALQGRGQTNLHPLSTAYPLQGANNIEVVITRLISYPEVAGVAVLPSAHVSLHMIEGKSDVLTGAAPRGRGPR